MASVIEIPESLAQELDQLAQSEHKARAAYVVDLLWRDVKRTKLRQALDNSSGAWDLANHPELAEGGAAYVDRIRSEPDERFEEAVRRNQIP